MTKLEQHRKTWQGRSDEWLFERLANELTQKVEEIYRLLAEGGAIAGAKAGVLPSVIYLVTNEDTMAVESAHWKLEDAKKEADDCSKQQPRFQFMVVELAIH